MCSCGCPEGIRHIGARERYAVDPKTVHTPPPATTPPWVDRRRWRESYVSHVPYTGLIIFFAVVRSSGGICRGIDGGVTRRWRLRSATASGTPLSNCNAPFDVLNSSPLGLWFCKIHTFAIVSYTTVFLGNRYINTNAHRGDCVGSVHDRVADVRIRFGLLKNPTVGNRSTQWRLFHLGSHLHIAWGVRRRPGVGAHRPRVHSPARSRERGIGDHMRVERDGDAVSSRCDPIPRSVGTHRVGISVRRAQQSPLLCGVRSVRGVVVGGDDHLLGNGRHACPRRCVGDRRVCQHRAFHCMAVCVPFMGTLVSTCHRPRRGGIHRRHTRLDPRISVTTRNVVGACHTHTHVHGTQPLSHTSLRLLPSWAVRQLGVQDGVGTCPWAQ